MVVQQIEQYIPEPPPGDLSVDLDMVSAPALPGIADIRTSQSGVAAPVLRAAAHPACHHLPREERLGSGPTFGSYLGALPSWMFCNAPVHFGKQFGVLFGGEMGQLGVDLHHRFRVDPPLRAGCAALLGGPVASVSTSG